MQQASNTSFRFTAFWLIFAIIIDIMGIGLVFPLLPSLFIGNHSAFLTGAPVSLGTRELCYALSIGLWAFGLFFGTPFLGDLSDKIGRKKILVVCLFLTGISYMLSALSLFLSNFFLFMMSRLMTGFFGASFPLAQAAFVDLSTPETKSRNISFVTLAASLGIVFGPLLSAFSLRLASGPLAFKLPFILAAVFSVLNACAIQWKLKETFTPKPGVRPSLLSAFRACGFMFFDRRVRFLSLNFFLLQLAWGLYIEALPMILSQEYSFNGVDISACYVLSGLSTALVVLFLQPFILRRMSLKSMYLLGAFVMGGFFFSAALYLHAYWQFVTIAFASAFELLGYLALIAFLSNTVGDDEQGKVLGGAGAIFGLVWTGVAPGIAQLLVINLNLPLLLAAVCGFLSFFLMLRYIPYESPKN